MKPILERLRRWAAWKGALLCLPAVLLCALAGRGSLASAAPDPDAGSKISEGRNSEWPQSSTESEDASFSQTLPEDSVSTDAYREGGRDALSRRLPEGTPGLSPSLTRLRAPKGWKEDGRIVEEHYAKTLPGEGELAYGRMRKGGVQAGDRLYVLRRDVATEADADADALYLERIGVVEVETVLPRRRVRLRVIKITGDLSPGDALSREPL
jgi:hypothetical protein